MHTRDAYPDTKAREREASLLRFEGVSKSFYREGKQFAALRDVTLDIEDHQFISIIGPSGCGKSTLLNLTAGLMRPTAGVVSHRGKPVDGVNTDVGYVTQRDNLLPWRTLRGNVELGMEIARLPRDVRRERAEHFIEKVGLSGFEDHYPHELSGGMRQRANIIRTLAYDPAIVLMDEPFGPLDALTRGLLQDQLLSLWREDRKTILFVTHDLTEAIAMSDRIVVMSNRPARVRKVLDVDIPRPRDVFHIHEAPQFREIYDEAWDLVLKELREGA